MEKGSIISHVLTTYIKFVEKTSRIELINKELVYNSDEKYIATFWHGLSYCLYPTIPNLKIGVITTVNERGGYIAEMCNKFGYTTFRVTDESSNSNSLFKVVRDLNNNKDKHIALATDGPLGPNHIPKDFTFVLAEMTKRKIMPVTIEVGHSIALFKRWDKFKIPLPFTKIKVKFNEPIGVEKKDRLEGYQSIKKQLTEIMEQKI